MSTSYPGIQPSHIIFFTQLLLQIFTADIIYHLTDQFTKHLIDQKKRKQEELKHVAIFPASLSILPNCVFAKRDPIIVGVKVKEGQLKIGSPICVPAKVRDPITV